MLRCNKYDQTISRGRELMTVERLFCSRCKKPLSPVSNYQYVFNMGATHTDIDDCRTEVEN